MAPLHEAGTSTMGAGKLIASAWEKLRARAILAEPVTGIAERTHPQRQATAPDALAQLIPKGSQRLDARIKVRRPTGRHSCPVCHGEGPTNRKRGEGLGNLAQRHSCFLRNLNHRDASKYPAGIASLVSTCAPARDETLGLVEVECRDRDA